MKVRAIFLQEDATERFVSHVGTSGSASVRGVLDDYTSVGVDSRSLASKG